MVIQKVTCSINGLFSCRGMPSMSVYEKMWRQNVFELCSIVVSTRVGEVFFEFKNICSRKSVLRKSSIFRYA